MTYGLPDSVVIGTARRVKGAVSKKRRKSYEPTVDFSWVWGWVGLGVVFGLAHLIHAIAGLF